ncbi:hypothetical protein [Methylobacterium oxalidis]|uniref:Uncharacterized protein n=1 Tax=Methylobacterium oxalidis TaxID=944322 RepID=A0A512J226_9HYPH|nr:hypothetical protein [Methylobacterium oxalidis]GEP04022.1 hypothetical protein MOX02_20600 [Methylobacterium oxalidis]GJE34854.1 hypothetical protein LDDCCGHA_5069 [Methylobacterium oxalidis]GLS64053.1 hypothetical protein GCM10007888_24340 [Methylobacterium oxalidis]
MSAPPQSPNFPIDVRGGRRITVNRVGGTALRVDLEDGSFDNDALAAMPALTLKANPANGAGQPQDVTPNVAKQVLGLNKVSNTTDAEKATEGNPVGDAIKGAKVYAQAGTGAVNKLIAEKLQGMYVLPEEFGVAAPDGDATAGFNAAAATGRKVLLLERPYKGTQFVMPSNTQGLVGLGDNSALIGGYGGDAANHILVVGDGTNDHWNGVFENFKFASLVNRTGGSAVLMQRTRNATMRNVRPGDLKDLYSGAATGKFLFNGVTWIDFYHARMTGCDMAGFNNDGLTIAGPNFGAEFTWDGGAEIIQSARHAVHVAGGAGGVKFLSGGAALARNGLVTSTAMAPGKPNPQVFSGSQFNWDTCIDYAVLINSASIIDFLADTLWISSSGKNALNAPIAGAVGCGLTVADGQVAGAIIDIGRLAAKFCTGTAAVFSGGICRVGGGEASFNSGNGVAVNGTVVSFKANDISAIYNTAYGFYADPALVTAAKAGTKQLTLRDIEAFGNTAGNSTGLSGAPTGAYSVQGCIGLPNA